MSLEGAPRIAIGCVDAVPHRATDVRASSNGDVKAAVAGLGATLDPPSDVHAPAEYRQQLAEVVVARAIEAGEVAMTAIETGRRDHRRGERHDATSATSSRAACSSTSSATTST